MALKEKVHMVPEDLEEGAYHSSDEEDENEEYDDDDDSNEKGDDHDDDDDSSTFDGSSDDFEDQGSSSTNDGSNEEDLVDNDSDDDSDNQVEILNFDAVNVDAPRAWPKRKSPTTAPPANRMLFTSDDQKPFPEEASQWMHADDFSSDDEDIDGITNRIGRIPLHWYDDYDHIGYDAHGKKVIKSKVGSNAMDSIDRALEADENGQKFTIYDALNAKDVTLTQRQITLIRRVQAGAFAHPEHDANPDYIAYFSGVDPEISGLHSNRYENKARFQPSKYEKLMVRRLLHRLKCGSINMDFLQGKIRDMNDLKNEKKEDLSNNRPFLLWKGDEEDELALRKGPQPMPAPKLPPPGHALSYNPPPEYLPTPQELKEWEQMDPEDRPYGHFIPTQHENLRSVGAYPHAVKERFERCLDLYLCPRAMKRRLNIDPESLVPRLPKASDLRPFPTTKCIRYEEESKVEDEAIVAVRCLSVSPDGQFLVSGCEDGIVRLWEVQTGRMLRKWDMMEILRRLGGVNEENVVGISDEENKITEKKPITSLEWNPNRSHHCILAAIGKCAVIISTGTGGLDDSEVTDALLSEASIVKNGGNIAPESRAVKVVRWIPLNYKDKVGITPLTSPISAFGGTSRPVALLQTTRDVTCVRWHRKGDYFVTVSPKAGAAAVLIHQLSKATSQQPFSKMKGEAQLACFHPQKPFLFVASKEHVRVYHLVKQVMVKRLLSGCRHISSIDVHTSGDHVIIGSLDRRLVWFDLDLANAPYKTLKYHERALRSVGFHLRYPLMASASDDGSIHVFHSAVYSDLMRNPLIVPVKVLRGHSVVNNSLGALAMIFHPTQPWLFSAGADGKIHLFQDL